MIENTMTSSSQPIVCCSKHFCLGLTRIPAQQIWARLGTISEIW